VARIHANGRIQYAGHPCRADGADADDVARVAALDLKVASHALGLAEANGVASGADRADRLLEAALDASLPLDAGGDWAGRDDYEDSGAESEEDSDGEALPPHFSRADVSRPLDFPLLSRTTRLEVELAPGEVLFLPAGWWHDVSSYSNDGVHCAVNIWFHPPDGATFDAPYSDGLWEKDWAHWQRDILPALENV